MQFNEYNSPPVVYVVGGRKKYGFFRFMFDCCMSAITGGLWLIWVFVRETRNR